MFPGMTDERLNAYNALSAEDRCLVDEHVRNVILKNAAEVGRQVTPSGLLSYIDTLSQSFELEHVRAYAEERLKEHREPDSTEISACKSPGKKREKAPSVGV